MTIDRRAVLRWSSVLAVGGALPGWLACSSQHRRGETNPPLASALRAARTNDKPVLVFAAADESDSRWALGFALGDTLEVGGDDLLADLALCEVACATPEQIRSACSLSVDDGVVGPLEVRGGRVRFRPIEIDTTPAERSVESYDTTPAERRAAQNAATLRAAIAGDALSERERAAVEALDEGFVLALRAKLAAGGQLTPEELDRGAAIVRNSPAFERERASLVESANARLLEGAPFGARWGTDLGCGSRSVDYLAGDDAGERYDLAQIANGEERAPRDRNGRPYDPRGVADRSPSGILCGMAFSGRASMLFLVFYTDEA